MGVIAESFVAYAQPLFDDTDGSPEQMESAMALAQICWNLAIASEESCDELLQATRTSLDMSDAEFDDFRDNVIRPMIQRHQMMFPDMHGAKAATGPSRAFGKPGAPIGDFSPPTFLERPVPAQSQRTGVGRNDPCPCGSGKKFKRCCGRGSA